MTLDEWLEIESYETISTGAGPVAIDGYIPPKHKLAIRLFDTEYEVGELTLELPDERGGDEPGCEKFVCYPLNLVMHPTRGVLNVGVVSGGADVDWRSYLRTVHEQLQMTCDVLREVLRVHRSTSEPHGFWSNRSLPFGPAIVRQGAPAKVAPSSFGADPAILADVDWHGAPERLAEIMAHHRDDAPETFLARELATALKTLSANYIDHVDCIATWEFVTDQLFERDDAA